VGPRRGLGSPSKATAYPMSTTGGPWRLDPQLEQRLEWANKAAEGGDWDKAIEHMRTAIDMLQGQEPVASAITPALRSNLAVCLANRGGKRAQDAMMAINMGQPNEFQVEQKIDAFLKRREGGSVLLWGLTFALLFGSIYLLSLLDEDTTYLWERLGTALVISLFVTPGLVFVFHRIGRFFRRTASFEALTRPECHVCGGAGDYRMDLPGRGDVSLCAKHNRELQEELKGLQANPLGRRMLESAEKDLAEAVELDPSLEAVKANLREIRSALAELPK
jgi:hypothetical protein